MPFHRESKFYRTYGQQQGRDLFIESRDVSRLCDQRRDLGPQGIFLMESTIQGRVYKFGDNVNSDIIIPGRYLIYIDRERLAEHAFEVLGAGFPAKLREFQILVAGRNFGCGSARE